MNKFSVYIHVPFCKEKCQYCDFSSFAHCEEKIESYFYSLWDEIKRDREQYRDKKVNTIFIGGGTPSFVDAKYITETLRILRECFVIEKDAEISLEANPKTLDICKLFAYRESGINRISLGVQASQNRLLRLLGRIHTFEDSVDSISLIKKAGFDNFNTDLMFALEGQSIEDFRECLKKIVELKPTHISTYALILEEGTPFYRKYNGINPVDDTTDRQMYHMAQEYLGKHGYLQYEISNFAKPGYQCLHNLYCWELEEYVGFGTAAHSYVDMTRFSNICDVDMYTKKIREKKSVREVYFRESVKEREENAIILGLRKIDGIDIDGFNAKFDTDFLKKYQKQNEKFLREGLIEIEHGRFFLSKKGLDVANYVMCAYLDL